MVKKNLATINAELQEQKERANRLDLKMVTFSLGGKDYGVDIMNVKEIAKADKFTYVPNAASFVRGVYNLRGDIIPIIDLRTFFHLPLDKKEDGQENMLILRIGDKVYGTIVDKIDKVVGINSETIQPPHPIFGDINIKFINGVVEKQGELYIILDVVRIFTQNDEEKQKPRAAVIQEPAATEPYYVPPPPAAVEDSAPQLDTEAALGFIREGLFALKHFAVGPVNEAWLRCRFDDWAATRQDAELQFRDAADADAFLAPFYSPYSGKFWNEEYAAQVKAILPNLTSNNIQVWNIGCGKGYETFSFACILKSRYPDGRIKIWANDNDIMSISQGPNMVFDLEDVPEYCRPFMARGRSGYSFNQAIKDSVLFEYHDVLNENPLPELDIILTRDLLSFLALPDQEKLIADFVEKLKSRHMVILGRNEQMPRGEWKAVGKDPVSAFMR